MPRRHASKDLVGTARLFHASAKEQVALSLGRCAHPSHRVSSWLRRDDATPSWRPRLIGPGGWLSGLPGADDLEVLVDEDVVRPVDADVVDLVLAVAHLDHTVDDSPWVGGQRRFGRLVRGRAADDCPR